METKFFAAFVCLFFFATACASTPADSDSLKYVGNSPEECMRIKFICEIGFEYFSDDKGCGCKKVEETLCPEERQQACTKEYLPVCGKYVLNVGETKYQTFGNGCTACAQMKVVSYVPGECSEGTDVIPTDGKKVTVACTDEQRLADVCTADVNPVCGWFNENIKCIKYPCAQTYSNACVACINDDVMYWTEGECPQ